MSNTFLHDKRLTQREYNKQNWKEKGNGKFGGDAGNGVYDAVRRGKGAVTMADLILWAIIESLRADGYEAEVKEVEQDARSV